MITNKNQIISIHKITKMQLIDHHKPDLHGPLRDVIIITYANGDFRILDLFSNMDVTDINYWKYQETIKSITVEIFKHDDISKYANEIE